MCPDAVHSRACTLQPSTRPIRPQRSSKAFGGFESLAFQRDQRSRCAPRFWKHPSSSCMEHRDSLVMIFIFMLHCNQRGPSHCPMSRPTAFFLCLCVFLLTIQANRVPCSVCALLYFSFLLFFFFGIWETVAAVCSRASSAWRSSAC